MSADKLGLKQFKHALATPLTNLLCRLEMLAADGDNQVNLLKTNELNSILTSVHQLRELVGGRDVSLVVREIFSLDQELKKIIAAFDKPHRPRIQLAMVGSEVKIFGHRRVFQETIQILLNNATEAYSEIQTNRRIKVAVVKLFQQALIFVNDAGNGMTWLAKMAFGWRGFSRKNFKSGLGVAKAKSDLTKYFAGDLRIWYSQTGAGSAIVMTLPIKE